MIATEYAEAFSRRIVQPPRIGQTWIGEGGIYAGITRRGAYAHPDLTDERDCHLIVASPALWLKRDVIYGYACDWARHFQADGHADFRLPNRREAALLYANLQDHFEDMWYWTLDPYHADSKCAWVQTFGYGRQADARMTDACRACAVRIIPA